MSGDTEETDVGEQTLIAGVRPVTIRDRLAVMAASPMRPRRNPTAHQKSCVHGLFDEVSRAQIDLVDLITASHKETQK